MKLQFRTLHKTQFEIEIEPSALVKDCKSKIQAQQGWEPSDQKLIYAGKILNDESPLSEYNIDEKNFLVIMVTKSKPSTAPSLSSAPETCSSNATPSTPAQPQAAISRAHEATPQAAPAQPSSAVAREAPEAALRAADVTADSLESILNRPENAAALNGLIEMGFPREESIRALEAAFFNADRAVEYLMNGIPNVVEREFAEEDASFAGEPTENIAGGDDSSPLAFLRNTPEFQTMRRLVRNQPQFLQPLMQQLGASNPELLRLINENQEEFIRLLNDGGEAGSEDGNLPDAGAAPPGQVSVQVTEAEREAINRLCALGFDKSLVIQAYFACEKNETLAANYLFDHGNDIE